MENLEYKIELIRRELLQTAELRGLSSHETVKLSVELDHLLNVYSYDDKSCSVKNKCQDRTIQLKTEKFG